MIYTLNILHGDDFHNSGSFITDEAGLKAFMSLARKDVVKAYPFQVVELESGKEYYKSPEWDEAVEIHNAWGIKNEKGINCNFCCAPLPK